MKQNQQLLIVLPERLADVPVRVIRDTNSEEIILGVRAADADTAYAAPEKKYVLIWRKSDYLKVASDEIQCVEADGSYSIIRLAGGRSLTVSFNLSTVGSGLPVADFIQIHRSCIINLRHMDTLMGNCVKVGSRLLPIGRQYRKAFLSRFIFLGVRNSGRRP